VNIRLSFESPTDDKRINYFFSSAGFVSGFVAGVAASFAAFLTTRFVARLAAGLTLGFAILGLRVALQKISINNPFCGGKIFFSSIDSKNGYQIIS